MIKDNIKTIDLMQNLIEQYFNQFFTYKKCNTDYKLVFDSEYPYIFDLHYQNKKFDFDFEDIISEFLSDKRLEDIPFIDISEFSKAITVGKICDYSDYAYFVFNLLDSVVSYNFEDSYITLDLESDLRIFFDLDGESITSSDFYALCVGITEDMKMNAYDNFVEIVDYTLSEIEYFLSRIDDEYEEQKECAEYAKENYEKDVEQLIDKLEADIKIKYPEFEIDNKYIYATDFDNSDFSCEIEINDYKIVLDITDDVFEQSGFLSDEDSDKFYSHSQEENYCYEVPYVNKFDYDSFLEIVEEKLNEIKEEILEDLSE